jgi:outer membrane protein OmpA-like peptidoglycan-associated protein
MMKNSAAHQIRVLMIFLSLLLAMPAHALKPPSADRPGSADHPALGRIPGALIAEYEHRRAGSIRFPLAMERARVTETGQANGEVWKITYYLPADVGPDGAAAIYRRNLEDKGFQIRFDHEDPKGYIVSGRNRGTLGEQFPPLSRPVFTLVGEGSLDGRQATVVVYAYTQKTTRADHHWVRLRIVQAEPMDARLDVVGAEQMASEIDSTGRVALYGILFDHDSDRLKPESAPVLAEIAKYLDAHPRVKLYVVGHTDNTGGYDYNVQLSKRRAAAVVKALTSGHGIAAGRLKAVGVGPVAPVASNDTESGRAKNRRVELVAQ